MELIILNIVFAGYLLITIPYTFIHKSKMTAEAYHHLWSHTYIVIFLAISINVYVYKGFTVPLIFTLLHVIQHVSKENIRLMSTNRWSKDVKDENIK